MKFDDDDEIISAAYCWNFSNVIAVWSSLLMLFIPEWKYAKGALKRFYFCVTVDYNLSHSALNTYKIEKNIKL